MNVLRIMLLAVAVIFTSGAAKAEGQARTMVFVLPPGGVKDGQKSILKETVLSTFSSLQPTRTMIAIDGHTLDTLGRISLQADDLTGARLKRLQRYSAERDRLVGLVVAPSDTAASSEIRFPQALDAITTILQSQPDKAAEILVVGSAFYKAEPTFSMLDDHKVGRVPNAAYLLLDDRASPYGTLNKRGSLAGATIHYCYTEADSQFASEIHRLKVEEAWTLHVQERGAVLATFSGDMRTCVARFLQGGTKAARTLEINRAEASNAPAMVAYERGVPAPAAIGSPVSDITAESPPVMRVPPTVTRAKALFAATWSADVDIDVFVRCDRSGRFLNWHDTLSPEGRHVFDWRQSPGRSAFEVVEMTRDVDVTKCEFFLNFYEARQGVVAAPPAGKVRISINREIWEMPFQFPAGVTAGNRGAGFSQAGRMQGPHWQQIDVARLLLLQPVAN